MNKIDLIELEHITGNQREIADVIGITAYRKLVTYFGGERIAVAKATTLINYEIAKDIAQKHNYSEEVMNCLELSEREKQRIIAGLK